MQVFKAFMKVLRKKLSYAIMYIGIFLGIAIPMSLSSGNGGTTQEMFRKETKSGIGLCIFDEDNTPESKAFSKYLSDKYTIKELKNDEEVIMDSLYYIIVDRVITINKGFSEELAQGNINSIIDSRYIHESINNVLIENDINSYFSSVSAYIAGGENILEAMSEASEALSVEADINVINFTSETIEEYPAEFSSYFRYMAYIIIAAVIGTLCPVLIAMNRKEVRFRTDCSSIRPSSYTKQIFLGSAVFVLAVWLIFMIAGLMLYGGIYKGIAWLAVLNSLIFAMVSASITVLIATFCTNLNLVTFVNQIVSLGMSFLCGVFVDQEFLGKGVLSVARFLPAYWYIKANTMLNGTEVFDSTKLIQYISIEAAFAVVIALITLLIGKIKYNSSAIFNNTKPALSGSN